MTTLRNTQAQCKMIQRKIMTIPSRMRNMLRVALVAFLLGCSAAAQAAPEVPGAPQSTPIALVGGTVHPVVGPEIVGGTVLFVGGKITAVGLEVDLPKNTQLVDVKGKHVYPGLFDADTEVGLVEIAAVRATVDHTEVGQINPNVRAQTAFNPDSELIPVTRSNGVLTVVTAPLGGLISGRAAVMRLDGWTWEQMTVRGEAAMMVSWPSLVESHTWRMEDSKPKEKTRARVMEQLTNVFADARSYRTLKRARSSQGAAAPDFDARWEAMLPVLEGKTPLFVRADDVRQIQSAVAFARKEGVKLVIVGGYQAPECAELLRSENVPVILKGVNRLPRHRQDPYDAPFTIAAKLHKAGVKFCISASDRMANIRNLPYHAATAVAFGLPYDEALKSITLYPAQITGVERELGSLESGKAATLFVSTGDPLDIASLVTAAYIDGREVDLSDRHKRLWKKYQEKYRQLAPTKAAE
ncbi:MAG: amidohydrolase family protein [Planctomycetia bacterium]|nr:amidohydrolase family protein [Planctomycetia bacterium]